MKTFILILTSILLVACGPTSIDEDYCNRNVVDTVKTKEFPEDERFNRPIITIEGCQYLDNRNFYGSIYTHKGNCKNPIHKCKCDTIK